MLYGNRSFVRSKRLGQKKKFNLSDWTAKAHPKSQYQTWINSKLRTIGTGYVEKLKFQKAFTVLWPVAAIAPNRGSKNLLILWLIQSQKWLIDIAAKWMSMRTYSWIDFADLNFCVNIIRVITFEFVVGIFAASYLAMCFVRILRIDDVEFCYIRTWICQNCQSASLIELMSCEQANDAMQIEYIVPLFQFNVCVCVFEANSQQSLLSNSLLYQTVNVHGREHQVGNTHNKLMPGIDKTTEHLEQMNPQ